MINTHRDHIIQVLSLFCEPGAFVDLKVGYQSYLLPKHHFVLQLVMALKKTGFFRDGNRLQESLEAFEVEGLLLPKYPIGWHR